MIKVAPNSLQPTTEVEPAVYVIDDDVGIRDSLGLLFRSVGLRAELFHSANELMQSKLLRSRAAWFSMFGYRG